METEQKLQSCVQQAQNVMAHAWMVRTFVKHSDEVEDFPELMQVSRTIFDLSLALESRIENPKEYFRMLGKKWSRLNKAAAQFAIDAPIASTHTNFQQAVISVHTCVSQLQQILEEAKSLLSTAANE